MNARPFLDTRRVAKDGTCHLVLSLVKGGRTAYAELGIRLRPNQWDGSRVVNHPLRIALNDLISKRRLEADTIILQLQSSPKWKALTAADIRDAINGRGRRGGFAAAFREFLSSKTGEGTVRAYTNTLHHLTAFEPRFETISFEEIDARWLTAFDAHLRKTCPSLNARSIHFRNIRAVFNAAIDEGLTAHYPFRKFKIRQERTRHRALTAEQLRTLFDWDVEEYAEIHRDIFKLMFLLIGINMKDLFNLECVTADGRVEYTRAKTGKLYSIKVEPEALEIIERYRGKRKLLSIADSYKSHQDYLHHLNSALKRIGRVTYGRRGEKSVESLFPELSSYWARHSWATAAARVDVPRDTIAAALGHGGNTVTDIYIDYDQAKVDRANRRVIDYVLYEKTVSQQ